MRLRYTFWFLFVLACVLAMLPACAEPLAQARIAVVASREALQMECPRGLYSLFPERVERCKVRLQAQQAAEIAYNTAVAADAIGSSAAPGLLAKLKGMLEGLVSP